MDKDRVLSIIFLIILTITSGLVIQYYWSTSSFGGMKFVPIHIMIFALIYILGQIAKRYFLKRQNWWDWIYYIGLMAMMLPIFIMSETSVSTFNFITDYGVLFLFLPLIFDARQIIQNK